MATFEPEEEFWKRLAYEPFPEGNDGTTKLDPAVAQAFLERIAREVGLSPEALRHIAAQGPARLFVYRKLMRATLREALESTLPRTLARLGDRFDPWLEQYCAAGGTTSHYLRDVATEFLALVSARWPADPEIPAYLLDLARLEAARIEVAAAPDPAPAGTSAPTPLEETAEGSPPQGPAPLALERPVRFTPACRLLALDHAVHELPDALDDRTPAPPRPTRLLLYRSPDHEVRFLEVTPLAAELLAELLSGSPLGQALTDTATRSGVLLDAGTVDATAQVLAELAERHIVLGAG